MAPPQPLQVSMSILKTRLSRCAHVIDARRCAGVAGSSATLTLLPLPRFAGVTNARCRLLGANTPWKRVRLTLGFGTRAASLAMNLDFLKRAFPKAAPEELAAYLDMAAK
ncbi:hypothetical protein FHS81_003661 [Pseudochelatococcus contaminans]|uniref:Uncharacterized protein n=1 Tax=Pseudochelatococcus contaminans TaxID=1538103 RepID=A0A7W5Z8X6_9HYPH|nr:hypothetical protein [Pseudochelatococcus contaminans]